LFLGGWLAPFGTTLTVLTLIPGSIWFGLKLSVILLLFILVRAAYPRYRYDQLMRLGWKVFLPLSLGWVILVSSILVALDWA
jgi:NADH-quinone oxidoreductase subunit H